MIQRREVVVVELCLGAFTDLIAQAEKDLHDIVQRLRDEVLLARQAMAPGKGDIDGLGHKPVSESCARKLASARLYGFFKRDTNLVRDLANGGSLLGRQRAQPSKHGRQRALLAEERNPHFLKGAQIRH